eukprot:gene34231-biopygen21731
MGSRKHRSTINQLLRLQHAIEDSKLSRSQLHVLYVDFENAYGSVEHDKLQHTMKYLGIPEDAVKVVADLYGGDAHGSPFKMVSKIEHHSSAPLMVRRGLVQGDSLSPLLFILYLEPLLRWLKAGNKGYLHRLTDSDKQIRTSSAAYVDDLALVTESAAQLATQVKKLELYSNWSGLRINKAKCGITGTDEKGSPIPEETYADITMHTPNVGRHGFPASFPADGKRVLLEFARRMIPCGDLFQEQSDMLGVRIIAGVDLHDAIEDFNAALKAARTRATLLDEDVKALFITLRG